MANEAGTERVTSSSRVCVHHPDRVTWVSCGRCGVALCSDCVNHGPVGVRCWDCLHGRSDASASAAVPVGKLMLVCGLASVLGGAVLVAAGIATFAPAPNLLLTMLLGGGLGWLARRTAGRGCPRALVQRLAGLAFGIVWVAGILVLLHFRQQVGSLTLLLYLFIGLRILAGALLCALFTWLLAIDEL
jgi:hypothetical protein